MVYSRRYGPWGRDELIPLLIANIEHLNVLVSSLPWKHKATTPVVV